MRSLDSNVSALLDIVSPPTTKQLHFFLSITNYFGKFMPKFAEIAEPVRLLLRKDVNWNWTSECNTAFEPIKIDIASSRVIAHFHANMKPVV